MVVEEGDFGGRGWEAESIGEVDDAGGCPFGDVLEGEVDAAGLGLSFGGAEVGEEGGDGGSAGEDHFGG